MSITTIIDLYRMARGSDFRMGVIKAAIWAVHLDYIAWRCAVEINKEAERLKDKPCGD